MKNIRKEEVPLNYISRSPLFMGVLLIVTALLIYFNYVLFKTVNPLGFLMLIPAAFSAFQSVWMLLNPFVTFFEDKIEIRQSLFHDKTRYYIDIQKAVLSKKGDLILVYHDGENEKLGLFGIQKDKVQELKDLICTSIAKTENTPV